MVSWGWFVGNYIFDPVVWEQAYTPNWCPNPEVRATKIGNKVRTLEIVGL